MATERDIDAAFDEVIVGIDSGAKSATQAPWVNGVARMSLNIFETTVDAAGTLVQEVCH